VQRLERPLGVIFLLFRIPVELRFDLGRGDRRRLVDRLSLCDLDDEAARRGTKAAAGREVRDVLDDGSGPTFRKKLYMSPHESLKYSPLAVGFSIVRKPLRSSTSI
jgi:hypothetical protein